MVRDPPTSPARRLRRLRYRTLDGAYAADFTYHHPVTAAESPAASQEDETENWLMKLDNMIARLKDEESGKAVHQVDATSEGFASDQLNRDFESESSASSNEEPSPESSRSPEARASSESSPQSTTDGSIGHFDATLHSIQELDLMMPDLPVDARLSLRSTSSLPDDRVPEEIVTFFEAFAQNLLPPRSSSSGGLDPHETGFAQPESPRQPLPPLRIGPISANKKSAAGTTIGRTVPVESGTTYLLEADEDLEITESVSEGGVVSRIVRVKDMALKVDRVVSFSEVSQVSSFIVYEIHPDESLCRSNLRVREHRQSFGRSLEIRSEGRKTPPDECCIRHGCKVHDHTNDIRRIRIKQQQQLQQRHSSMHYLMISLCTESYNTSCTPHAIEPAGPNVISSCAALLSNNKRDSLWYDLPQELYMPLMQILLCRLT